MLQLCGRVLAVAVCLTALATSAFAQEWETPMRRGANGHYVAELKINGDGPYYFAIDSAASVTTISAALIRELNAEPIPGATTVAHGANGAVRLEYYEFETLGFGDRQMEQVRLVGQTSDAWPDFGEEIHGVLGIDIIADYIPVFLESAGTFRLIPQDVNIGEHVPAWTGVPLNRGFGGIRFIDIDVEGVTVNGLFDTGASRNIMSQDTAIATGFDQHSGRVEPALRPVKGISGNEVDATRVQGLELTWGAHTIPDQTVVIADLSIFALLRMSEPAMVVGAPVFEGRDFIIDYPNDRVLISPAD